MFLVFLFGVEVMSSEGAICWTYGKDLHCNTEL